MERKKNALWRPFVVSSAKKALTILEVQKRILEARKAAGEDAAPDSGAEGGGEESEGDLSEEESEDEHVGLFRRGSAAIPKKFAPPAKKKAGSVSRASVTTSTTVPPSRSSSPPPSPGHEPEESPTKTRRGRPSKDAPPKGIVDMTGHMETCKEELKCEIKAAREKSTAIFTSRLRNWPPKSRRLQNTSNQYYDHEQQHHDM